jgi:hypothetical protein
MSWTLFLQLATLIPWAAIWFSLLVFVVMKPEKVKQ